MRDIEKVPVVAWVHPNDVLDFGKGDGESAFMFAKHGKWDVPLVRQSDHLTALTSAQEESEALYGALKDLVSAHAVPSSICSERPAYVKAQAAITAYEAKRAKPEGSNQ